VIDSAKLSALATFADVVADATRRFNAGELDAAGYIATLRRQGYSHVDALTELRVATLAKLNRSVGAP
jgi:hypothetical protein